MFFLWTTCNALHHGVGDPTGTFYTIFIFSISSSFFFVASRKAAEWDGEGGQRVGHSHQF